MSRIPQYATESSVDPELTRAKALHRRIDLQYQRGSSDKVYIVYIYEDHNGEFQATGYYGRRGTSLARNQKGPFSTLQGAIRAGTQLANSKENGSGSSQYTRVNDENFSGQTLSQQTQVIGRPNTAQGQVPVHEDDLDLSQVIMPEFDFVDHIEFASLYLNDDSYITENIPAMKTMFLLFKDAEGFNVYQIPDGKFVESKPKPTGIAGGDDVAEHIGTIFAAYPYDNGEFGIFDIIEHPSIRNTRSKEWKARRAILSTIFADFYPGRDPYDPGLPFRLQDYVYDDKDVEWKGMKGIVVAKHIDKPYSDDWIVTTKP